jgi:hypothetical protein
LLHLVLIGCIPLLGMTDKSQEGRRGEPAAWCLLGWGGEVVLTNVKLGGLVHILHHPMLMVLSCPEGRQGYFLSMKLWVGQPDSTETLHHFTV